MHGGETRRVSTNGARSRPVARNLEIKARTRDLHAARVAAQHFGALDQGTWCQKDTYFRVPNGRLKLRLSERRPAELIWYQRRDEAGARASDYSRLPIADPETLRDQLTGALGVLAVVEKRRQLLLWRNIRIHLDDVVGLGWFIEFEALVTDGVTEASRLADLALLEDALGIQAGDYLGPSYADLIGSGATQGTDG